MPLPPDARLVQASGAGVRVSRPISAKGKELVVDCCNSEGHASLVGVALQCSDAEAL